MAESDNLLFSLDADTLSLVKQSFDSLIENFGKECTVVYPGIPTSCNNCVFDSQMQRSANRYRTGGPIPFSNMMCPQCNGQGKIVSQTSEIIKMSCEWKPEGFVYNVGGANIRDSASTLRTKCYARYLEKLNRCEYIVYQNGMSGFGEMRFQLNSKPGDSSSIIQGKYVVALWKEVK